MKAPYFGPPRFPGQAPGLGQGQGQGQGQPGQGHDGPEGRDRERRDESKELRVNRRIRVPEVRVIGADGQQLGIMQTYQALQAAEEAGLDLVEVSPKAAPPVCRVMDYGKFKYEQKKKTQEAKRNQTQVSVKEVKFRPKTDEHDFQTKVRHVLRFLEEGNKAKVSVFFRGREIMHSDRGMAMLNRVMEAVSQKGQVEALPKLEGRSISMMIAPKS